jgi:hypothetical protein
MQSNISQLQLQISSPGEFITSCVGSGFFVLALFLKLKFSLGFSRFPWLRLDSTAIILLVHAPCSSAPSSRTSTEMLNVSYRLMYRTIPANTGSPASRTLRKNCLKDQRVRWANFKKRYNAALMILQGPIVIQVLS